MAHLTVISDMVHSYLGTKVKAKKKERNEKMILKNRKRVEGFIGLGSARLVCANIAVGEYQE